MKIILINRLTNIRYYVSKFFHPCTNERFALFTTDVVKVDKIVKKFIKSYKIIVINSEGEIINHYK